MKRSSLEPSLGGVVGNGMGQRGEQVPVPHLGGGPSVPCAPFLRLHGVGVMGSGVPL